MLYSFLGTCPGWRALGSALRRRVCDARWQLVLKVAAGRNERARKGDRLPAGAYVREASDLRRRMRAGWRQLQARSSSARRRASIGGGARLRALSPSHRGLAALFAFCATVGMALAGATASARAPVGRGGGLQRWRYDSKPGDQRPWPATLWPLRHVRRTDPRKHVIHTIRRVIPISCIDSSKFIQQQTNITCIRTATARRIINQSHGRFRRR